MRLARAALIGAVGLALAGGATLWLSPALRKDVHDRVLRTVAADAIMERAVARLDDRLARVGATRGSPVFVRIFKEEAELELWTRGKADGPWRRAHTYPICAHSGDLGPKLAEGDRQAPEGFYRVGAKQLLPTSRYYRAFNIGFPNAFDRSLDRTGSFLMVHGGCVSIGCYAMTDEGVAEIYTAVEAALDAGQSGVAVHAFPFRMTPERMAKARGSRWFSYWRNLAEGYRLFEETGAVPRAGTADGRYTFNGNGTAIRAW